MNGLEAVELMKQGSQVSDGEYDYKIENNLVLVRSLNGKLFNIDNSFDFTSEYEEYIEPKPLTGWERVEDGERYRTIDECSVWEYREDNDGSDVLLYNIANYFSTKEKAEEINFKQMLFRKLQRFSDENGGNEIDWKDPNQEKWMIRFDHRVEELCVGLNNYIRNFGQVYFISEEIAEKAIELFRDELIKYFTGDFGGEA